MDQNQNEPQTSPKQQVVERVRQATNVLVTVRANPSVDELAATIGLTLMLNKLGKHATAVFSGQVPSTLEFLKPEETLEANTDSLRDFIVSLDKSKADKLRYKVEENVVKIFITPYRTSLSEKDLEFTQGDFNVDVVLALGVTQREELDQAITSHGRILHDATVITVTAGQHESTLGAVNWQEPAASSLSEMLVSVSEAFQGGLIDSQMATAFLTGIVAETERFSNPKTSPKVMTMAAQLMAAGANQQLIANELQKAEPAPAPVTEPVPEAAADMVPVPEQDDGSLSISHDPVPEEAQTDSASAIDNLLDEASQPPEQLDTPTEAERFLPPLPVDEAGESFEPLMTPAAEGAVQQQPAEQPQPPTPAAEPILPSLPPLAAKEPEEEDKDQIHIDDEGNLHRSLPQAPKHKIIEPLRPEEDKPEVPSFQPANPNASEETMFDPMQEPPKPENASFEQKVPDVQPLAPVNELPPMPAIPADEAPAQLPDDTTLLEIEESVHSPHLEMNANTNQDAARSAVENALSQTPENRTDLNALPLGTPLQPTNFDSFRMPSIDQPMPGQALPPLPSQEQPQAPDGNNDQSFPAPPPVPPPLMPQQ